jgi:hypothetical protein
MRTAQQTFALQRELRRIGVDVKQLTGLGATATIAFEDVLAWFRAIPTDIGHAPFMVRLTTDGPQPGMASREMPVADPGYRDPEMDEVEALHVELERVWPAATRPPEYGLWFPQGNRQALQALRTLPDGAGPEALRRAFEQQSGEEGEPPLPTGA